MSMSDADIRPGEAGAGRLSKGEGSFYTPRPVAEAIVSLSTLPETAAPESHVLDPAAGDGALLVAAIRPLVDRLRSLGLGDSEIAGRLVANVHAIELDAGEADKCRERLSEEAGKVLDRDVPIGDWDVVCGDACGEWRRYEGRMGFVLMNPPYVRIHNLSEKPDSPYVEGMCDLYYAFFDYAQRCLAPGGLLSAIAPSSWMTARAGRPMRDDLRARGTLKAICDYGHLQVFAPYATTYTALTLISTDMSDIMSVWGHDGNGRLGEARELPQGDAWHAGLLMPDAPDAMDGILSTEPGSGGISVRNGYATNLDRLFMSKERRFPSSPFEIPVAKASRAEAMWAIYPYDETGRLVPIDRLRKESPGIARALEAEKMSLLARTQVDPDRWWCYARTQGIADTYVDKVTVQSLMRDGTPPRTMDAPAGTGVFGGIYVTGMRRDDVEAAVSSDEFRTYVKSLRKYKSGGYYAYGGKDLGRFLSWWRENGH